MLACAAPPMAVTAPTSERSVGVDEVAWDAPPEGLAPPRRTGPLVLGAVVAVLAYAVFAHGAAANPDAARLQVVLAGLALVVVGAWATWSRLRVAAPPAAWAGLGLLAGFAAWSGLSLAWSVAPSGTWTQLNRTIAYVLVVGLALVAGAWYGRAVTRLAYAYAGLALAVALYALAGKVLPDLFHQAGEFSRLRAPVQYWNALALFCAMAVPIVLRLAVDETRPRGVRLAAVGALPVYLATMGLTYSRGGVLAGLAAVGVLLWLGGARLRSLLALGLGLAGAAPSLAVGFTSHSLTTNGLSVAARRGPGLLLGGLLVAGIVGAVAVDRWVLDAEARTPPDPARARRVGRGLLATAAVAAAIGIGFIAASDRGLTGTVSHQWHVFTSPREAAGQFDPGRLLSTNSGNRWVWWEEAVGAWSDRPLAGWGAGSFPVLHREYRKNGLDVLQPHSVPLEFLAETGLVGAILALGGVGLLLVGAAGAVRRLAPGPERGLAVALLAASVAWAGHSLYDWDWDIPGVTLPALAFLGVLCARGARARLTGASRLNGAQRGVSSRGWTPAGRAAAAGAAALVLGTVALSGILPSWADSESANALASVRADATPGQLERAQASADFAARLDPLSVDPLLSASALALRRGRVLQARDYLLRAAGRQPDDVHVWQAIAQFEAGRGDRRNIEVALARVLALDPRNRLAPFLVASQEFVTAPYNASATATGTPLVAYAGEGPAGGVAAEVSSGLSAIGSVGGPAAVAGAGEARRGLAPASP
jgi:hypothetical protein